MTLTFDSIKAAAERLKGHIERTPMRHSRTLSEITGANVWVKFENQQFTAAYKERGALNKLLQLTPEERKRGVIAASAGNHAQGLAYHGARLGIPVTIVMPRGTPFVKVGTGSTEYFNVGDAGYLGDTDGGVLINFDDAGCDSVWVAHQPPVAGSGPASGKGVRLRVNAPISSPLSR